MDANQLIALLKNKHSKDVFVAECKGGPTWMADRHSRMDAWAMKRSWARPMIVVYEVKVSRSDFLNDDKWQGYLEYCNAFYFVCAPDVAGPSEMPADAGLLLASKNAKKLYTKKKAPYRDIEINPDVFRYILMSRARIGTEYDQEKDRLQYWRDWLTRKRESKSVGYSVAKRTHELVAELKERTDKAESENKQLAQVKEFAKAAGIDLGHYGFYKDSAERRVNEFRSGIGSDAMAALINAERALESIRKHFGLNGDS